MTPAAAAGRLHLAASFLELPHELATNRLSSVSCLSSFTHFICRRCYFHPPASCFWPKRNFFSITCDYLLIMVQQIWSKHGGNSKLLDESNANTQGYQEPRNLRVTYSAAEGEMLGEWEAAEPSVQHVPDWTNLASASVIIYIYPGKSCCRYGWLA